MHTISKTFVNNVEDTATSGRLSDGLTDWYKEGIFVGYRGYDRSGVRPRYPFGFGLSYTTFRYSGLKVEKTDKVTVEFDITNTGKYDAWETAQVYVTDIKSSVPRPQKELKGYEKIFIKKGETVRVSLTLDDDAFSFYDVLKKSFVVEPGEFIISVGPSSDNLPLKSTININPTL